MIKYSLLFKAVLIMSTTFEECFSNIEDPRVMALLQHDLAYFE